MIFKGVSQREALFWMCFGLVFLAKAQLRVCPVHWPHNKNCGQRSAQVLEVKLSRDQLTLSQCAVYEEFDVQG